jgi:hypothetical protein
VAATDVYSDLLNKKIPYDHPQLIEAIVDQADGERHVIVPDLQAVSQDADFALSVSADHMQATVTVRPAVWGKLLTVEQLAAGLRDAGVQFGLIPGVLEEIVAGQDEERSWTVAEGQPPISGQDASIRYHFDLARSESQQPAFLPDGRVDLRELDRIIDVESGQLLGERIPPTEGSPGRTVLGEELAPRPGRDVAWPAGKGVVIANGQMLAEWAGQLIFHQKKLTVSPLHQVGGDVDYSTGNIRFVGNVEVRGSVKPGFLVEAEGDVRVFGWVDSANIFCQGSVVVGGGIQGQGRGEIKAGADVTTRFIENCHVTAGGNVKVGEDILHSTVFAGKSVEVGGRRGLIAGGTVRATDYVHCKVLGGSLGTTTCVEVGTDPSLFEQYGRLQGEIAKMEEEQSKLALGISRLSKLQELTKRLPDDKLQLLHKLQTALHQRQQEITSKRQQLASQEAAMLAIKDAYIKVTDVIHPGTRVVIGKSSYFARDRLPGGIFRLENGEVTYGHS